MTSMSTGNKRRQYTSNKCHSNKPPGIALLDIATGLYDLQNFVPLINFEEQLSNVITGENVTILGCILGSQAPHSLVQILFKMP